MSDRDGTIPEPKPTAPRVALAKWCCPECGAVRVNTQHHWSVCPNGHGRLHPPVDRRAVMAILEANWQASFPEATLIEIRVPYIRKEGYRIIWAYRIAGREGLWRPAKMFHVPALTEPSPGEVFACVTRRGRGHVWRMERSERHERLAAKQSM